MNKYARTHEKSIYYVCRMCRSAGRMLYISQETLFACNSCGLRRPPRQALEKIGSQEWRKWNQKRQGIQQEVDKLNKEKSSLDGSIYYRQRTLQSLVIEIQKAEQVIGPKWSEISFLDQAIAAKNAEIGDLSAKLEQLEGRVKAEAERLERETLQPILDKIKENEAFLAKLTEETHRAKADCQSTEARKASLEDEHKSLQNGCRSLRTEKETLDKECSEKKERLQIADWFKALIDEGMAAGAQKGPDSELYKDLAYDRLLRARIRRKAEAGMWRQMGASLERIDRLEGSSTVDQRGGSPT